MDVENIVFHVGIDDLFNSVLPILPTHGAENMDPASILAIVGGVCMVVKGCIETYETWSTYREHKAALAVSKDTKRQEEKLSKELESSPSKVQAQYNQLLDSVGGRFTRTDDSKYPSTFPFET